MKIANVSRTSSPIKTPWQDVFRQKPGFIGKGGIAGALEQPARYSAKWAYEKHVSPYLRTQYYKHRLDVYRKYINYWNYPAQYVSKRSQTKFFPKKKGSSTLYLRSSKRRRKQFSNKSKLCKCRFVSIDGHVRKYCKRCAFKQATRMRSRKFYRKNYFRYRY